VSYLGCLPFYIHDVLSAMLVTSDPAVNIRVSHRALPTGRRATSLGASNCMLVHIGDISCLNPSLRHRACLQDSEEDDICVLGDHIWALGGSFFLELQGYWMEGGVWRAV
jgi:hypothetical protein